MLPYVLSALDRLDGLPAARVQWASAVSEKCREAIGPFLRPTGRRALSLPCPLGCGCVHEVVLQGDGSAVAVCVCDGDSDEGSGGCEPITGTQADLEVLEFNTPKFGRDIARALNLRPVSERTECPRTVQIGSWSTQGTPVFLNLDSSRQRALQSATLLACRFRSPFILMVADAAAWNGQARALLDQSGAGLFHLPDAVHLGASGGILPLRAPEELFAAFTRPHSETSELADGASAALGLIEKLESSSPPQAPGLITVFRHYCMEGLTAAQVAKKCRCSKTTVMDRLARIRQVTGRAPASFRNYSGHLERKRDQLRDERASSDPWAHLG